MRGREGDRPVQRKARRPGGDHQHPVCRKTASRSNAVTIITAFPARLPDAKQFAAHAVARRASETQRVHPAGAGRGPGSWRGQSPPAVPCPRKDPPAGILESLQPHPGNHIPRFFAPFFLPVLPAFRAGRVIFCQTGAPGHQVDLLKHQTDAWLADAAANKTTLPRVGAEQPATTRSSVLFPLPEGPTLQTNSCRGASWNWISSTARKGPQRTGGGDATFCTSRMGETAGDVIWADIPLLKTSSRSTLFFITRISTEYPAFVSRRCVLCVGGGAFSRVQSRRSEYFAAKPGRLPQPFHIFQADLVASSGCPIS